MHTSWSVAASLPAALWSDLLRCRYKELDSGNKSVPIRCSQEAAENKFFHCQHRDIQNGPHLSVFYLCRTLWRRGHYSMFLCTSEFGSKQYKAETSGNDMEINLCIWINNIYWCRQSGSGKYAQVDCDERVFVKSESKSVATTIDGFQHGRLPFLQ